MELIDLMLSIVLGIIMFGVGTSIQASDFEKLFVRPKPVFYGLTFQMIVLPILAFLICFVLPIKDEFKIGIIILALSPGGATSNFISYLLNLKTALSVTLTSINSFLILLTVPIGVNLALNLFGGTNQVVKLSIINTFFEVFSIIIIPAIMGILVNHFFSDLLNKLEKVIKITSTLLLGIIFIVKFFAGEKSGGSGILISEIFLLFPITLIFHLVTMISGYIFSINNGIGKEESITIGIEVGLQNTALALLISSVFLADNNMSKPALVYAMFSFFTSFLFGYFSKMEKNPVFVKSINH